MRSSLFTRSKPWPVFVGSQWPPKLKLWCESSHEICVTLNRADAIDPSRVVGSFSYHHPVFTHAGLAAQRRFDEVSGPRRTHYCGAYWGYGFHEDGVVSALRVCERFGRMLV